MPGQTPLMNDIPLALQQDIAMEDFCWILTQVLLIYVAILSLGSYALYMYVKRLCFKAVQKKKSVTLAALAYLSRVLIGCYFLKSLRNKKGLL